MANNSTLSADTGVQYQLPSGYTFYLVLASRAYYGDELMAAYSEIGRDDALDIAKFVIARISLLV